MTKTKKEQRYQLVSDNDGHEYTIPVEQVEEFYEWLEDEERSTYEESDKYEDRRVDGVLTFTDPRAE